MRADEHEVAVGVTQYTLSAEQWERVLMSSAATWTMEGVDRNILTENCFIAVLRKIEYMV